MRLLALALLSMAFAGTAAAETPLTRAKSGQLTAPVRVAGGAPVAFAVDTGASGCSVSERFAKERRLLSIGPAEHRTVRAPGVELDGALLGDLTCRVAPDRADAPAGVIGADALNRYVVAFDVRRMRLSLHGGAQHGQALVSPQARLVRAWRLPGGLISAPVELNGAVGLGVVDTGAVRSTFNRRFADAAGVEDVSRPLGLFKLAGASTRDVEAGVADAPTFAAVGMRDEAAMILGLDRLAGLKLVIDYPRRRIWFDPG